MAAVEKLITDNLDIWSSAIKAKSAAGRGTSKKRELYGIKKLRELILELAVRGLLVPQEARDEPASELLNKIMEENSRLVSKKIIRKPKSLPSINKEEIGFEVPSGWEVTRLGTVGYWAIGSGFPKKEQGIQGEEILFSKVSDMNLPGNEKFIATTIHTVSRDTATRLKLNLHTEGTVVFPKIGGAIATNKRRVLVKPTAIDNNCLGLSPTCAISSEYLFLYLSSLDLTEYQVGTSVPALSQGTLELIALGLPPLAEQHRIVAKVDELMALCDQLEQQTETSISAHQTLVQTLLEALTNASERDGFDQAWSRVAEHFDTLFTTEWSIDQLKQTILQLAVKGKLVTQDPNDEPASELLKKIANEKARLVKEKKIKKQKPLPPIGEDEKPFELPAGWEWARIGDAAISTDYGLSDKSFAGGNGVPVLAMGHIQSGKVLLGGQKVVPEAVESLPELYLKNRDLLYNRTNSAELVGKSGIYLGKDDEYTFASYLIRIRTDKKSLLPEFINLNMLSPEFRATQIIPHLKQQCGQANVNGTIMKNMLVAIAPELEIKRVVTKVDELITLCDSLKSHLKTAQTTQLQLADAMAKQALG